MMAIPVVERLAESLTAFAERRIPDAFIFALLATFLVVGAAIFSGSATPAQVVHIWGSGVWDLLPFTMQMSLMLVTGYVVATSPPVFRMISAVVAFAKTERGAIA